MTSKLFPAIGLLCLLTAPTASLACDATDPALTDALRQVFTAAKDPMIAEWSTYLNQKFYDDLSCKLSGEMTPDEVLKMRKAPSGLIDHALSLPTRRNQSDALMLMLYAMQEGAKT
ncbi:hypothetical protein O4H61_05000 [Roseovarius aestuarii]|nr:hypothetical protein [Roseovarius aestuarii]